MATQLFPYIAILAFSTVLSGILTGLGVRCREEIGADWFVVTMGLATVWNAIGLASFFVSDITILKLFEMLMTILSISVPVVWFTFVVDYSGRGYLLDRRTLAALWFLPAIAFVSLITYPFGNTLYYASLEPVEWQSQVLIESPPGPLALLTVGYLYVLFVIGFWLLIRIMYEHENLYTGQALSLLVGTVVGAGVALLKVFNLVPESVPIIPAGIAFLGLAYTYGLYRHRLLDLTPATRRIGSAEALNDLDEGVVIVDRDWDVVAINESACQQFDCKKAAVLGSSVATVSRALEFEDPPDQAVDLQLDNRVYEVAISTVEDSRGRQTGYALVIRDVTVQRGRKQRLEVLNRILRHNLRNDMTVIKGYANEIASRGDDETRAMAKSIDNNADELLSLAEKARDIEGTITGGGRSEQSVGVAHVVESVVGELESEFPEKHVDIDVHPQLTVSTDAATLELVLHNVIENALRHGTPESTADGGADPSGLGAVAPDNVTADVSVRAERTGDTVEITVADDGPGIPAAELAVIERGTETALEHCSGLGLWLVDWGATRLGADLEYDTTDGTCVTLSIPREQDPSSPGRTNA